MTNDVARPTAHVERSESKVRVVSERIAQTLAVVGVVALLGLLVWDVAHSGNGSAFAGKIRHGDKPFAPAFSLPVIWNHTETWPTALRPHLLDGKLTLHELSGYPVVINFWASWCLPCKAEAPAFASVARRFKGRVVFVGMDTQDLTASARAFLRRYKVNYVSIRDGTDTTNRAYGLTGVPETYYLDRGGRAVEHAVGIVSKRELLASVKQLFEESQ